MSSQTTFNGENDHTNLVSPKNQAKNKSTCDHDKINLLTKEGIDKACKEWSLKYRTENMVWIIVYVLLSILCTNMN